MFQLFATSVIDTGSKFGTGIIDIGGNSPVSTTPAVPGVPGLPGYERVVDLLEKEIETKTTGSKRPASDSAGGQFKRPRTEIPRASWIEGSSLTAKKE